MSNYLLYEGYFGSMIRERIDSSVFFLHFPPMNRCCSQDAFLQRTCPPFLLTNPSQSYLGEMQL